MTPQAHTIYSVCLLFALNALLLWTGRRQRRLSGELNSKKEIPATTTATAATVGIAA